MKVAVTGASGFIGQHVLAELVKRNIEIVATSRTNKKGDCFGLKNIQWIKLDIESPPGDCYKILEMPDVLIHLAWGGLPNYRSLHHFDKELPIHYRFLSDLVNDGLQSLVSVGTCFEYGFQSGPIAANAETYPDNPYGLAKDTLHKQLRQLQELHPFKLTWARLFYMYGSGQAENSLYSSLRIAVERGDKVFKMTGGEQLRDYLPVEDVAKDLVDLAFREKVKDVVNICSGQPISVRRLVEKWKYQNNWDIELALGEYPYPDYEPHAFWGIK